MVDVLLGRYTVVGPLGHGSMAKVWLAHLIGQPHEAVVVKVMHPHVAAQPRFRQLFDREVQSMSRLRHPYIVRLIDSSFDEPAGPSLVMEYVPGENLAAFLEKQGRLAVGHAGLLLGYLCHALQSAHTIGIVHRDLKPANLMVQGAGTLDESIRVMDLGLAEFAAIPHFTAERLAGAEPATASGTPIYISPESLRGDEIDPRADLYSLGVVLFQMLTGELPFLYSDVNFILRAHLHEQPRNFAAVGVDDVPPAIEELVQLCLSKYAVERPQSAREVAMKFSAAIGLDIWEATRPETVADEPHVTPKPLEPTDDGKAIVHRINAWMPERIAVVKLRGFLEDLGGRVVASEPGLLRIRLSKPKPIEGQPPPAAAAVRHPVEIELRMEKANPKDNCLTITALFRPYTDPVLLQLPAWRQRCQILYKDLQAYLMAR